MNAKAAKNIRAIARRFAPNGSTLQTRTGYSVRGKPFRNYKWIGYRRTYQLLKAEYLAVPGAHRAHWVEVLMGKVAS